MAVKTPITIAFGDGIGPEIMQATLNILEAANADIDPEIIEIGEKVYLKGFSSGIPDEAWNSLKRTKVLLKAPITTPQGGGYKSLNVTLRKTLGLFANVRPCASLAPFVPTKHPNMDLVIVRENEEGLYAGIEHRQTEDVYQCLKIVTRHGCENIINYAFEYAEKFNRKKITCMSKDNIMKMTDGVFHEVFNEVAKQYPNIETEHYIIDIGTAMVASCPEKFDVIVTSNLYGDILSDVTAQIAGSVGLAGSSNVGNHFAMFEAIHGSAPLIAGQKIANPSGLLNAAVQMLIHINQPQIATTIQNAWLKTIEDGIHTADIYNPETSTQKVNTIEFSDAVISRLGKLPEKFKPVEYKQDVKTKIQCVGESKPKNTKKQLVGIDIFLDNPDKSADELGELFSKISDKLELIVISSKGLKVWPNCMVDAPYMNHACCRFQTAKDTENLSATSHSDLIEVLSKINDLGLDVIKTENLYTFDGKLGYSLAQGQ